VEVWLLSFLTAALDGGEWSASRLNLWLPSEIAQILLNNEFQCVDENSHGVIEGYLVLL
jgi:hypothetical protein